MFEILIIAVVIAFVVTKFQQKPKAAASSARASDTAQGKPAPAAETVKRVLTVEGTESFTKPVGFVKGHGLNPTDVQDLRMFRGDNHQLEALPSRVRECLVRSYQEGLGRGLVLSEIINHSRALRVGEALYFALINRANTGGAIVAFVDKIR